ncbi:Conserved_hypothetical protein [Hexamita inflata]|uniref:Uncharacterized protein n=1 Tax=Hexamita inflata TaxID=28002 RepID=A0AA86NRU6_9EUKA|nr:Conserved hypothetical protein [Hexamita inflata]
MLTRKQQLIIDDISCNDFQHLIPAALQLISDLMIQQITIDDYNEAYMQISLYFNQIEQSFGDIVIQSLPDSFFYQLMYIKSPLHRNYLLALFGSALYKQFKNPDYLIQAVRYAVQVQDPLHCLFLRYYIQQSFSYFHQEQPFAVDASDNESLLSKVLPHIQYNYTCAVDLYQQLTKRTAVQATNYAFFCLEFLRGFEDSSVGLLLQTCTNSSCPYLQFEILRFLTHCQPQLLKLRFSLIVRSFVQVLKFQKLEYSCKQLLISFLNQLIGEQPDFDLLVEFVELTDGQLSLDQVLDCFQKLIIMQKNEQFTYKLVTKTFERLFTKFRSKAYNEFYLLHQFVQQVLSFVKSNTLLSDILIHFNFVYEFLKLQNKTQAGRVTARICTELAKRDISIPFNQVVILISQINECVSKAEYQFADVVYALSCLISSCIDAEQSQINQEFVDILCNLSTECLTVAVLNMINRLDVSEEFTLSIIKQLLQFTGDWKYFILVQLFKKYQNVELAVNNFNEYGFEYAKQVFQLSKHTQMIPYIDQFLEKIDSVNKLITIEDKINFQLQKLNYGAERLQLQVLIDLSNKIIENCKETAIEVPALLEVGWTMKQHYKQMDWLFFEQLGHRVAMLLNKGVITGNDEKRQAWCLLAAIEEQ